MAKAQRGGRALKILGFSLLGLLVVGGIIVGILFATGVIKTGGRGGSPAVPTGPSATPGSLDVCGIDVGTTSPFIEADQTRVAKLSVNIHMTGSGCVKEGATVTATFEPTGILRNVGDSTTLTGNLVLNGPVVLTGTIPSNYITDPNRITTVNGSIVFRTTTARGGNVESSVFPAEILISAA